MKRMIIFLACLLGLVAGVDYFLARRGARIEEAARLASSKPKSTVRNIQLIPGQVIHLDHGGQAEAQPDVKPKEARASEMPDTPATVATKTPPKRAKGGNPEVQDPIARAALSEVGVDPDAEAYWLTAINDPTLSDHERQDLIEDLNEEGFEDPKNLTVDDLPLILRRIEIIETYAPDAMDDVNAAAFSEAYKDLVNMFIKVAGQ